MALFNAFNISATGMSAQRFRTDIISQNVANVDSTRTEDGEVYRRKAVTFSEKMDTPFDHVLARVQGRHITGTGVKVSSVYEDNETDLKMVYDPSHPDADENGYVTYPNVNIVTEMTNMIDASRSYEANVTAFNTSKSMAVKGLDIGK
ncbi:MAG: flagellar basal body rod protein FlgC [Lachnospiraceae bacterium]|nr:flagellar basal body rod protein FlgC [Lachnospiraceae bacterium]